MTGYPYKPVPEMKPVGWGSITAMAAVSALAGTIYNVGRIISGSIRRAPADANSFEAGFANPYAGVIGGAIGVAIVLWLIFWGVCRVNRRTTGWRSFLIFATAAAIPSLVLVAFLEASVASN